MLFNCHIILISQAFQYTVNMNGGHRLRAFYHIVLCSFSLFYKCKQENSEDHKISFKQILATFPSDCRAASSVETSLLICVSYAYCILQMSMGCGSTGLLTWMISVFIFRFIIWFWELHFQASPAHLQVPSFGSVYYNVYCCSSSYQIPTVPLIWFRLGINHLYLRCSIRRCNEMWCLTNKFTFLVSA